MNRLPTELLYAIVKELSDDLDVDALTALRGTNRRFRDVVFRGWMKPMLEEKVGRRFLPEAIALYRLPTQSMYEWAQARDWFMFHRFYDYLKAHGPRMKNKNRARIQKPQAAVDDSAMSELSVHVALALVKFHREHIMQWAASGIKVYAHHSTPLKEPAFPDEVSLDDEVIKAAIATYQVEHYLRALVCAAAHDADDEWRNYFTQRLGLEFDSIEMDQCTVYNDFLAYTPRLDMTLGVQWVEWPSELLMFNSSHSDFTAEEAEWNNGDGPSWSDA